MKIIGLVLLSLVFLACGDTYYSKSEKLGPGVGGQYFVTFKNVKDDCSGEELNYNFSKLVEMGKPKQELRTVLYVTPLNEKETQVNLILFSDDRDHRYTFNGIAVSGAGVFLMDFDGSETVAMRFEGQFWDNRVMMELRLKVFFVSPDDALAKHSCEVVFTAIGEKFVDYEIMGIPDKTDAGKGD